MPDLITCFQVLGVTAFLAFWTWFAWMAWRGGVKQAKEFDATERREAGLCGGCGYDLCGAPHRQCPECGEPIPEGDTDKSELAQVSELDVHALRDNWPAEVTTVRRPGPSETPVIVHSSRDGWACDLLAEHLEARGVQAQVDERSRHELMGAVVCRVTEYAVVVWSEDEGVARQMVDHFRTRSRGKSGNQAS